MLKVDSTHQTQAEKDRFRTRVFFIQISTLNYWRLIAFDRLNVFRDVAFICPASPRAVIRMRRTAKTIVRHAGPVFRVVPRLKPRQTEIRNLVMLIAGRANLVDHRSVHLTSEIVVGLWPQPSANLIGERRALMHVQQIKRQMLRPQLQRACQISLPASERLARQSRDQIKVDVCESRLAKLPKRRRNIGGGMRAAELLQFTIVKGLRAKTRAIDAEPVELSESFLFSGGAYAAISRIQLESQLSVLDHIKAIVHGSQNPLDLRRR